MEIRRLDSRDPAGGETPSPPLLAFENAELSPPGVLRPLLRGVSFTLHRGQVAVLLGGNGAGKTTLLRSAAGLWPVRGGTAISPCQERFDPTRVGVVLEEPGAQFVAATVGGELEFALENVGRSGEAVRARVEEMMHRFRLEPIRDRDPRSLSPGEQQRCLLAAALVHDPALLLLDDVFLYLSSAESSSLWREVRELVRSRRVGGVLLATHDPELALAADRVGLLGDGTLRDWGPPETVLRRGIPPGVETPVGLWLETRLRETGWVLGGKELGPEAMAMRLAAELRS